MDPFFNAVSAWNQTGLIVGGLVFLLIGAGLLFWFFYVRLTGKKVRARIVAVRVRQSKNDGIAPELPAAQTEEKPSSESFNSEFKKSPGTGIAALFFAFLIVGVPLLFTGIGAWFAYDYLSLINGGIAVEARVIDNVYQPDSDGGGGYHAVARFTDLSGAVREHEDRISIGSSPSYATGATVTVHYSATDPAHAVIGGFWHNMVLPLAFMALGGLFLFVIFGGGRWLGTLVKRQAAAKTPRISYGGEMYHAVYEYKSASGEAVRAEGDSSSNSLADKVPGTVRSVYVRDDRPDQVSSPGLLVLFFAVLFGAPGLAMLWAAFAHFESSIFTLVFIAAFAVFCFIKIKKLIKPRDQWDTKESFQKRMREKREEKRRQGRLLTMPEIQARLRAHDRYVRRMAPVLVLLGAGFLAGGAHLGQGMKTFVAGAQDAEGRVVRLESTRDTDGHYTYYPVVSFEVAGRSNSFEFRDRVGSNPALYNIGDTVDVLYDPASPHTAMIDRGPWNWAASGGLLLAGLFMLWAATKLYAGLRRRARL